VALLRAQRRVVADAISKGCRPMSPDEAYRDIRALTN